MISKPIPAESFYHTCRYICLKPGAEVLVTEGVREHNYKVMAEDFIRQQQLRPSKAKACLHAILSFHPSEKPSNELMVEIARKYLERLGIVNTQFAVVKHTDRAHPHLHIVANMVDNKGQAISDSWIGLRGKKVAQALTQEYNLVPAIRKDLALTHTDAMNEQEAIKYKIYQAISENLPHCRTLEDLEKQLTSQGIEVQYKYKGQTEEKQGISFKTGNACFKGSQIDRKYSLGGLQKTLEQHQQEQRMLENNERADQTSAHFKKQRKSIPKSTESPMPHHSSHQDAGKGHGSSLIDILMRPEEDQGSLPYELSQEAEVKRRQRKQKRSR
ncbi:MAG: hypothetical protein BGO55_01440 [Sphingobacteriales bacterium 50-39]|nr:relaxase/mobilization nuclease domain-containing protein [Sphingobacteriales bacterium]OJW53769.1 MAG: hypothetical protein BGO55_01440 [Sphingobacteriales bacterium 50-39]